MIPNYPPGFLKNGGTLAIRPRPRQCKFCAAAGESYGPVYICPAEACQARKAAAHKATRRKYDAKRRSA